MTTHAVKGMRDLVPPEAALWAEVEAKGRDLFALYRYEEIRTPLVEEKILFARTLGETTSVVEKEMYAFQDRKGKWLTLRPEGTAGVVRAFVEKGLAATEPLSRFFYIGSMYRYEQPQQGRQREFHQIGVEAFGSSHPFLDAEVIHMAERYFVSLGLSGIALEINSLGCPICRPKYQTLLADFLKGKEATLCEECQKRIVKNPLRALDCKKEGCRQATEEAPILPEHLCESCERHLDQVLEGLGLLGTSYRINPRIVRGLDYYLRTTFEFTSPDLGAQNAVAGGGRYDGLVHLLGGPNLPGFGFAIGMERLIDLVWKQVPPHSKAVATVFVAPIGEKGLQEGFRLAKKLREEGIAVEIDYEAKSLKSSMRRADRIGASHVIILGDDELKKGIAMIKEMKGGGQKEVKIVELSARLFV